jgi:hypothetical protein
MKYLWNCIWLTVPIVWMNLALADRLPESYQPAVFWSGVPRGIALGENTSRIAVFLLPLLMPLHVVSSRQRAGLALYAVGVIVYFLAWATQIWYPRTKWSKSRLGFMAPAFTPAAWLAGIALIGETLYFGTFYRSWMFLTLSLIFLVFHNAHGWAVYSRIHQR